jgi:hypothetical protein
MFISDKKDKRSNKQKKFAYDTILCQLSIDHLPKVENNAQSGRVRHKEGYVNVVANRLKPTKRTIKKDGKKLRVIRAKTKIKDITKPHKYKENDQNLGYIKKRKFGRFTTNPRTIGRGVAIRPNALVRSEYDDEA